jgi:two-component system chemotaxis sensor kinase CheA
VTTVDDLQREFLDEAADVIVALHAGCVRIAHDHGRGSQSPGVLNDVFRQAHSLKGLAGVFGVEIMVQLAHELETLLDGLRFERRTIDDELVAVLFECVETCAALLQSPGLEAFNEGHLDENHHEHRVSVDALLRRMADTGGGGDVGVGVGGAMPGLALSQAALATLTTYEDHRLRDNVMRQVPIFLVRALVPFSSLEAALTTLTTKLAAVGELIASLPSADPAGQGLNYDLVVASTSSRAEIERITRPFGVTAVERIDRRREQPFLAAERGTTSGIGLPIDTVRVERVKLDALAVMVGELAIARGALDRVVGGLRAELGEHGLAVELVERARTIERGVVDLHVAIGQLRMAPIGHLFERMTMVVQHLADEVGKEVEFRMMGDGLELDRRVVEGLADPLMHLLRNAIDHGVEAPGVRLAAGKPRAGRLELRAFRRGDHVVIEVNDDGGGIDVLAVKQSALERGLVDQETIGLLGEQEVWGLVFLPGLTTKRAVTRWSGRGVGLDIVKAKLARMAGRVDVGSIAGIGTRFIITLPAMVTVADE